MRVVLIAFVALWLFPSSAVAEVIHACVIRREIRIVDDPADCPRRAETLSWSTEPAPVMAVFDITGAEVGLLVEAQGRDVVLPEVSIFLEKLPGIVTVDPLSGELAGSAASPTLPPPTVWFEDTGCEGQPYVDASGILGGSIVLPGDVFLVATRIFQAVRQPAAMIATRSRLEPQGCSDGSGVQPGIPLVELSVEDLGLTFPLPAPLYVAPRGTPAP